MDSSQKYYAKNKAAVYKNARKQIEAKEAFVRNYKKKPCQRCGIEYPHFVMDLHHREPGEKVAKIGKIVRQRSWQALIEELNKCDVLCANCHRLEEYSQLWLDRNRQQPSKLR